MAESFRLDGKDTEILRALQHNARLSNKELAAKVNLSTTPTPSGCVNYNGECGVLNVE